MKNTLKDKIKKRRKTVTVVSVILALLVVLLITYLIFDKFFSHGRSAEDFKEYILSYGYAGVFVAIGIQMLQIVVALLPGEFIEIGIGYSYGAVLGTIICMTGIAIASSFIFVLTKKWGIRLVELFTDPDKINRLRFINSDKKLYKFLFILFIVPGTPKDLITYFAGLTRISLSKFLVISLVARAPAVITSTLGGHYLWDENYLMAGIIFAVTAVISLGGIKFYSVITKHRQKRKDEKQDV